jgi:hypothetical protein
MSKTSRGTGSDSRRREESVTIGLVYDLRDDYLAEGYTEEQVAEFDSAATIGCLEQALRSLGYTTERIGNGLALVKQLACGKRWTDLHHCRGLNRQPRGRAGFAEMWDSLYLLGILWPLR